MLVSCGDELLGPYPTSEGAGPPLVSDSLFNIFPSTIKSGGLLFGLEPCNLRTRHEKKQHGTYCLHLELCALKTEAEI